MDHPPLTAFPPEVMGATAANFPGRPDIPGRYAFNGRPAPEAIQREYVGKRIPDQYRKRGAANPITYARSK